MSAKRRCPGPTEIVRFLTDNASRPMKVKELADAMRVSNRERQEFVGRLRTMEEKGQLYRVKGDRYALPKKLDLVVGRLSVTRRGDGFVAPEVAQGKDVFVRAAHQETALDGDKVVVRVESKPRGRNPEGRIVKVLERAHTTVVGELRVGGHVHFVVPRSRRLVRDVLIPEGEEGMGKPGDLVVARITDYGSGRLGPVGTVETVLGPAGEGDAELMAILFAHGIDSEFPPEVIEAAEAMITSRPTLLPGRSDRRDLLVFTIDPADAKDHDDALSIEDVGGGSWEVGIHIADVTWYVKTGDVIDREAVRRATSTYLVDRVVPMLPHELSSDLCSLRSGEDRYAVSVFVVLDPNGEAREARYERTLLQSRHKLSYEKAEDVLKGRGSVDAETDAAIHQLDQLARKLRARRVQRGALDFDLPEARVLLGPDGAPTGVERVDRLDSHRLIEDFMLLANETVARASAERHLPVLFRTHESPSDLKLQSLRRFLQSVGHGLPAGEIRPKHLQQILEGVAGKPEAAVVSRVVLRSMKLAKYTAENGGHFGLAAEHYAHFTSPIRRYPDLLTHRSIVRSLIEGRSVPDSWSGPAIEELAEHTSLRERASAEAERESVELKKAEYMERHLGDEFEGTVSGVVGFGIFVLLDDVFVEGLIHVNTLEDDFYHFREDEYSLVGERRGRRFRLGDRLRVQVARVSRTERQIDFVLAGR